MKRRKMKLLMSLACALFLSSSAFAEDIGRFTSLEGKVDVFSAGRSEAVPAAEGQAISVGDVVRTKRASKAEITFADNTIIRLADDTRVEIKEYQVDQKKKRINAVINVDRGKIRAIVSKVNGKADFTINTPNASGNVKGTDVIVFYQKSSTGVVVVDGKFSVFNLSHPDKVVTVANGNTSVIPPDEPPQEQRKYLAMEMERHEADTKVVAKRKEAAKAEGYAEPGQMGATVVKVAGSVLVRSRDAISWHDAKVNEVLGAGDEIETKEDGKIEIRLENGNVINLKSNTKLKLQKLTQDMQTGDYENLLESNIGKIRAQVEKIKGNSKFEIKTPTAVAAVKGTILYLSILPNLTSAYFEGGNGTLNNIISGITKVVADGNSSSADGQGNTSEPSPPSDEERSEWTEGWEAEGGGEGYSPPGGGEGEGTDEEAGGGAPDTGAGGGDTMPFDDVPITETMGPGDEPPPGGEPPPSGETPPGTTLTGTASGNFGNFGSFNVDEESSFDAAFAATTTLAPWSGTTPTTVTGTYSNPNAQSLWWGDVTGTGSDGGAFEGWTGGSWHSWEGVVSSIYIDSSGMAGNLFGYVSGTNDAGILSGSGDLFAIPVTQTDILPGNLVNSLVTGEGWGNLFVSFNNGNGYLDSEFDRQMMKIDGENWGIWREIYSAEYDNPNGLANWIGAAGGNYNEEGYFFSAIEGIDNLTDALRMDIVGAYLDYYKLGAYYGTILGTYFENDSYYFEGIGLGGFIEEPLTLSGFWGEENTSLYNNSGYGNIEWIGEEYGLIGSTIEEWWATASFPILAMGEYYVSESAEEPFIWNTQINSYNATEDNSTTLDGGAFWGFTGGIWNNQLMDGAVAALYLDPEGNAGLLRGDISGNYYRDIEMWLANGTLTPTLMPTDSEFNPANLYLGEGGYINQGGIDDFDTARLYGEFGSSQGYIYGWLYSGDTYAIGEDAGWGIYDIKLGNGNYYSNPDPETYTTWSGVMGGPDEYDAYWIVQLTSGTWANNEIRADVLGTFLSDENLGTIEGDFFGVNSVDEGTWIGTSIGTWNEEPLAWSAYIDAAYHYYYSDEDYIDYYDSHYGIIGATESPFPSEGTKTVPITLMGETYPEDYITWWGYLSGSYADDSEIPDGFIAGRTNSIEGMLVSLYVDTSGNAGTLEGTFDGDYYPELDMWQAEGTMTATNRSSGYAVSWRTEYNYIDGYLNGNFNVVDGGEIYNNYSIYDISYGYLESYTTWLVKNETPEPWGIYNIELGGYYDPETSDDWRLVLGGDSWRNLDGQEYWLATVTGSQWSNQRIAGELAGNYITTATLGTITGNVLGSYDTYDSGVWEAIALGTFTEEPLKFVSNIEDGIFFSFPAGEPDFEQVDNFTVGWFSGLLGGTQSLWTGSAPATLIGEYSIDDEMPTHFWGAELYSYNYNNNTYTTYDGGAYVGMILGTHRNPIEGMMIAFYIDPDENAGYISGSLAGETYSELGMFEMDGTLTTKQMAEDIGILPEELYDVEVDEGLFVGSGLGSFEGGGEIEGALGAVTFNLPEQNWGVWMAAALGEWSEPTSPWQLALGGVSLDESAEMDGYWLGTVKGADWSNGRVDGEFRGIWLTPEFIGQSENIRAFTAGEITGEILGTYDEVDTTWQATGVGEWVELAQLDFGTNADNLLFNDAVAAMVEVPITETYASLLQGAGTFDAGGTITGAMDISFYAAAAQDLSGIWASLINGNYTGPTGNDWTLPLTDGAGTSATLTGTQWSDGQWLANVSGTAPNDVGFDGQAGGTYTGTDSGEFTGVGAGTWEQTP